MSVFFVVVIVELDRCDCESLQNMIKLRKGSNALSCSFSSVSKSWFCIKLQKI